MIVHHCRLRSYFTETDQCNITISTRLTMYQCMPLIVMTRGVDYIGIQFFSDTAETHVKTGRAARLHIPDAIEITFIGNYSSFSPGERVRCFSLAAFITSIVPSSSYRQASSCERPAIGCARGLSFRPFLAWRVSKPASTTGRLQRLAPSEGRA